MLPGTGSIPIAQPDLGNLAFSEIGIAKGPARVLNVRQRTRCRHISVSPAGTRSESMTVLKVDFVGIRTDRMNDTVALFRVSVNRQTDDLVKFKLADDASA